MIQNQAQQAEQYSTEERTCHNVHNIRKKLTTEKHS